MANGSAHELLFERDRLRLVNPQAKIEAKRSFYNAARSDELLTEAGRRVVLVFTDGADYITVTKDSATPWSHVKPEVFALITGRRSLALGVATAVAALGWFVHTMGAKVQENLPAASPFEWAYGSDPLVNGPDPGGLLALAATCIVLIALAAITFPRRDLRA